MADYDAIVCGGGSNGLAAAIRLAEAGWSVCLLEANEDLGGAARTLESTLPGFSTTSGPPSSRWWRRRPRSSGATWPLRGLRFVHAQLPAAHPFPGNQAIALGRSAVETAASIDKVLGDGAAWFALDEAFGPVMKPFLRAQMQRWPFEELAKVVGRLRLSGGLQFARMVVSGSARSPTASSPNRPGRSSPAGDARRPATRGAGTGIYALLLSMLGQRFGMPVVEGGRDHRRPGGQGAGDGVEILTGRRVGRIVVERGRAVAVEAGGEAVSARRAVICALEVGALVRLAGPSRSAQGPGRDPLLPARPRHLQGRLGARRSGAVGGRGVPAGRGGPRGRLGDRHEPLRLGGRPTASAGQADPDPGPAVAGRSLARPGGQAHPLGLRPRPRRPDRGRGSGRGPRAAGAGRPSRSWSGWKPASRPTRRTSGTGSWPAGLVPPDLEAADASLAGGDIQAGSFAIDQQLLFRPGPSWWRWGTPVKGLYLAGARRAPGAGASTAPAATWPPARPWPTTTAPACWP